MKDRMARTALKSRSGGVGDLDIRPISGALGAEISGIDLAAADERLFDAVYRAFVAHQVIIIRDQKLTTDQYLAFARRWGAIQIYPFMKGLASHPQVLEILKTESDSYAFGNAWHSDGSFNPVPPKATMLYALELPPAGGDTLFASGYAAYDTLSPGMREMLDGLRAIYVGEGQRANWQGLSVMQRNTEAAEKVGAVHPIVRTHPDTGRKALYFSNHIVGLEGLADSESAPILGYLRGHAIRPEFTCRLAWQPGSLAVWDNRCTQHYAIDDYAGQRRRMHRINIEAEEAPY
jgi:taurine dioxygenase